MMQSVCRYLRLQPREVIEAVLRVRVENAVTAQGIDPLDLVLGYWMAQGLLI